MTVTTFPEKPIFRATSPIVVTQNGQVFNEGTEFEVPGWKLASGTMEPVNESAHRIVAYYTQHRTNDFLPAAPFDHHLGRIFLPAVIVDPRSTRLPPLPTVELPGMPRYRTKYHQTFGIRSVRIGDEFAYCGWPGESLGIEPVNDAAEQVCEYFRTHRENPRLPAAPWCEFEQALVLPELSTPAPSKYAANLSFSRRDTLEDEIVRYYIAASQSVLRAGS